MGGTWRSFLYGGLSSVAAEMGTFPLDTIKTRLQVQRHAGNSKLTGLKYKGMIDAFIKILKEEGIPGLYSGIAPAVLRQTIYGTLQFGTYCSLKRFVTDHEIFEKKSETGEESVAANVGCAALAAAISSALANPTDVLKVRMQAQSKRDSNIFKMFHEIYHHEGLKGLWAGVGYSAQRCIILSAVVLPLYDACKNDLMGHFGDSITNHSISSFISSIAAAVATCPFDVIRTRLMNQLVAKKSAPTISSGSPLYKGGLDCAMQTIKHEGFMALYKGFIPTWLRMGPWNIIFFLTFEELNKLL